MSFLDVCLERDAALFSSNELLSASVAVVASDGVGANRAHVPAGGSYDVGDGTVDLAGQNIYVAGDLLIGSGQITAQDILIDEGGRVVAGTGSIRVSRHWTNRGAFEQGRSTVYFDSAPSSASNRSLAQVSGETIFWNAVIAENKTV